MNQLIIKKKKKKHHKVVLLARDKLSTIEVLISKTLIGSYISNYKFVSVNNVLGKLIRWKNKKSWNVCGIYQKRK